MSFFAKPFRIRRLLCLPLLLVALVLELQFWSAVVIIGPAPAANESLRLTYSYFNPTPCLHANFGPFLTAMGTCALLLLAVIFCLSGKPALLKAATILSGVLVATSLMPLLLGPYYFTLMGALISASFAAEFACLLLIRHWEAAARQAVAAAPLPAE